MFENALKRIENFIRPLVVISRRYDGALKAGMGAYIIINEDGWILTVSHIVNEILKANSDIMEVEEYKRKRKLIESNPKMSVKQRKHELKLLHPNPAWIVHSFLIVDPRDKDVSLETITGNPVSDLAVAKLTKFDPACISAYPVFKNPTSEMLAGTSLCKLGYPFNEVKVEFDAEKSSYHIKGAFPPTLFPLDGIFTREVTVRTQDGAQSALFVETSSPGLKGHSGGPTFDEAGNIWAIQSQTVTLPLDFAAKYKHSNGEEREYPQFLNLGLGSHVKGIIQFLDSQGIKYQLSR